MLHKSKTQSLAILSFFVITTLVGQELSGRQSQPLATQTNPAAITVSTPEPIKNQRTVELTYRIEIIDLPPKASSIKLWLPTPSHTEHQTLLSTQAQGEARFTWQVDPDYGNPILFFDLSKDIGDSGQKLFREVKFTVTRHRIFQSASEENSANPTDFGPLSRFLEDDILVPVTPAIRADAYVAAGKMKTTRAKAKALFDHITTSVTYHKSGQGWGRGDAVYACDQRKGNCTDFHSLFIAEARSLLVPTRFVMGLPLPAEETSGLISGYHCWAEFFDDQKGWTPLDASEAHKNPKTKSNYFATLDRNRIQFTVGRDLRLPGSSVTEQQPLNYFIYPYVEVDGQPFSQVTHAISFKDVFVSAQTNPGSSP